MNKISDILAMLDDSSKLQKDSCVFLKNCLQEFRVHLQGIRKMHCGRGKKKPVPVLQIQKVHPSKHEKRW